MSEAITPDNGVHTIVELDEVPTIQQQWLFDTFGAAGRSDEGYRWNLRYSFVAQCYLVSFPRFADALMFALRFDHRLQ